MREKLTVNKGQFHLGGEPFRILSGAIHYFRVPHQYWEDRLSKLKACGFNTVETYIPWNFHEPAPGDFHFDGDRDIIGFIQLADQLGLHVIIRPSPFICAEWEFGGLPAWLLADKNMRIRSADASFLKRVDMYYDVLLPKLVPLQTTNGGPIIAMQVENEYGSYGNDQHYMQYLKDAMIKRGVNVLLFTSDGPEKKMLDGGTLPDTLATVNFGSRAREALQSLETFRPGTAKMCMEFWNGWFDHWGEKHHTRNAEDVAKALDELLSEGASVNFYMFHGGTNFDFYNGANHDGQNYQPTVTSYDYDCPLSESGDLTEKFHLVREVLGKYQTLGELELPEPIAKKAYGEVQLDKQANLFDVMDRISVPFQHTHPVSMESIGQNSGFILYRTEVKAADKPSKLHIKDVHDRALIFVDGVYQTTVDRWGKQEVLLDLPSGNAKLDILVENMGRVNYGPHLADRKGITESVRLDYQFLYNWTIYPLPFEDLTKVMYRETDTAKQQTPSFFKGTFDVKEVGDTFLQLHGWKKGIVFINGRNLGRYWEIGPQQTLYVPGPYLQEGENELVVFELHGANYPHVVFQDEANLG